MKDTAGRPRVRITADDPTLTPLAGLVHVATLVGALGLIGKLDERLAAIKQRARGLAPGAFLVSMAESMLAGGDCLADVDALRLDGAGAPLRSVEAPPAPTTAGQYFRRFAQRDLRGVEEVAAGAGSDLDSRMGLAPGLVTLDADSTCCEVFGATKQGVGWNYEGRRSYQPFVISWAERRRALAADLLAGNDNPVACAEALLTRALKLVPRQHLAAVLRADAGFYSAPLMGLCRHRGVRFSISAKRTQVVWREIARIAEDSWTPAIGMAGAEVAETTHQVHGVGACRLIVRRVALDPGQIAASKGRRRRTVPQAQLALALGGAAARVYAYSAIVTDLPEAAAEIEHFHRQRTSIEDLFKDAKLGVGLGHLPMGDQRANAAWMWACLLAYNLSSMLTQVAGREVRAHAKRLRRELIRVPARLVRSGRRLTVRLPKGLRSAALFTSLYAALLALGVPG